MNELSHHAVILIPNRHRRRALPAQDDMLCDGFVCRRQSAGRALRAEDDNEEVAGAWGDTWWEAFAHRRIAVKDMNRNMWSPHPDICEMTLSSHGTLPDPAVGSPDSKPSSKIRLKNSP